MQAPNPKPHSLCELSFFSTEAGGLKHPLTGAPRFPVRWPGIDDLPIQDAGELEKLRQFPNFRGCFWTIFIIMDNVAALEPGWTYQLPVEWLDFERLVPYLSEGMEFELYPNMRHCGNGKILALNR